MIFHEICSLFFVLGQPKKKNKMQKIVQHIMSFRRLQDYFAGQIMEQDGANFSFRAVVSEMT